MHQLRMVRIAAYGWNETGGKHFARYQFAIDQADCERPAVGRQARNARYRQRIKARSQFIRHVCSLPAAGSVFNWRPNA